MINSFGTADISYEELAKSNDEWDQVRNARAGKLNELDKIDCPICKNKGIILDWRNGDRQCSCMARRITYVKAQASGMDTNLTFENYGASSNWQRETKERAFEYAKHPNGWFFIGGQSGAGKTHICTAICLELIKTREIKYLTWRLDAGRLKMLMKDDNYFERLDDILNADVLYIDDLFKGSISEADLNLAFTILDYRGRYKKPTIISSELTANDIWAKDAAIGGRIHELCTYGGRYPISISGDDKNQRAKMRINQ